MFDKLRRIFAASDSKPSKPVYPEGKRIYAVGDIHGRADLLDELHAMIEADSFGFEGTRQILYIGDYLDRGEDSRRVIDILLSRSRHGVENIYLLGNHEHALLDFLIDPETMSEWLNWGGRETLYSYGIEAPFTPSKSNLQNTRALLERAMPANHLDFLENCQLCHHEGSYYFVHAGIRPDVPLEKQRFEDQLWIREQFTLSTANHGAVIVHGHSISEQVEILPNRIGIDTGAYYSGILSCVVLEGTEQRLLQTGAKQ